jgi:hypothetical protein
MVFKYLFCSIVVLTAFLGGIDAHAGILNEDIVASDAWVRAMPPSQTNTAAYMVIKNKGPNEVILTSVSSDISESAEIHQMSDMKGMMNMSMVSKLSIPGNGEVVLKPGAYHIMLVNLKKPIKSGEIVQIRLFFKGGTSLNVKAEVREQ